MTGLDQKAVIADPQMMPSRISRLILPKYSGYDLAIMPFAVVLAPEAVEDLGRLTGYLRSAVLAALEKHLRHEPDKISRSRIKRLRGTRRPQYRLHVDKIRVFYDIIGATVEVLAIVAKSEAEAWLASFANPE